MSKELVQNAAQVLDTTVSDRAVAFLDSLGLAKDLNAHEKKQFIEICNAFSLNPYKREIYAMKIGTEFTVIVGYEIYLQRAEASGLLDSWEASYDEKNKTATVTIYRKDWSRPFVHTVLLSEYIRPTARIWKEKPATMLKKVAIAQGFRMAFPIVLGGMPYTNEEQWNDKTVEKIEFEEFSSVPPKREQDPGSPAKSSPGSTLPEMKNSAEAPKISQEIVENFVDVLTEEIEQLILEVCHKTERDIFAGSVTAANGNVEMLVKIKNTLISRRQKPASLANPAMAVNSNKEIIGQIKKGIDHLETNEFDGFGKVQGRLSSSLQKHLEITDISELDSIQDVEKLTKYYNHLREKFLKCRMEREANK